MNEFTVGRKSLFYFDAKTLFQCQCRRKSRMTIT